MAASTMNQKLRSSQSASLNMAVRSLYSTDLHQDDIHITDVESCQCGPKSVLTGSRVLGKQGGIEKLKTDTVFILNAKIVF